MRFYTSDGEATGLSGRFCTATASFIPHVRAEPHNNIKMIKYNKTFLKKRILSPAENLLMTKQSLTWSSTWFGGRLMWDASFISWFGVAPGRSVWWTVVLNDCTLCCRPGAQPWQQLTTLEFFNELGMKVCWIKQQQTYRQQYGQQWNQSVR